jgi:bile acid:Na+ symporter, BASS family
VTTLRSAALLWAFHQGDHILSGTLVNALAAITLVEMMFTLGLGLTPSAVLGATKDWRLIMRALLASYAIVPALAVALLIVFKASPMVSAGLLIVAACPGAPYGPPFTNLAKGDVSIAVGLMLVLAATSAILSPVLLGLLLPAVSNSTTLAINIPKLVSTLVGTQLLPLCLGILFRHYLPQSAKRLKTPAGVLSIGLNLCTLIVVLIAYFPTLATIRARGYLGMLCLLLACMAAGALMGGGKAQSRKTVVITTAVRNAGVSLVVATTSFGGTAAVSAATAYALFQTLGMALIAIAWGKLNPGLTVLTNKAA